MKFSLALAAFILIAGSAWQWNGHRRLAVLREEHRTLESEARRLGIIAQPHQGKKETRFSTTGHRRARDTAAGADTDAAHKLAAEVIGMILEMKSNDASDEDSIEMRKKLMAVLGGMANLKPAGLRVLIADFDASDALDANDRLGIIGFVVGLLAEQQPEAALDIITGSKDFKPGSPMGSRTLEDVLSRWAENDPLAALDWTRRNADKVAGMESRERAAIIKGAAKKDPALALQLLEKGEARLMGVIGAMATDEERADTLEALRRHLATMEDGAEKSEGRDAVFSSFNTLTEVGNFARATEWLSASELSAEEISSFARGLEYHYIRGDSGKWIDWLADNADAKAISEKVPYLIENWTREDYKAAGEWLTDAPANAAKNPAVRSYAETVAPYEPDAAEQWALTLPAGDERRQTLKTIRDRWPANDEARRAEFSHRHNLDE